MKLRHFLNYFLVLLITINIGNQCLAQQSEEFEISKNLDVFTTLYKQLYMNYVDDINHGEIFKTGIDAMLETLDPYTVYIPEAEIEDYRLMTTGQYGGIGALIHKQGDDILISEPYEGFPAFKSGLRAGDKILEVNGKTTKSKSVNDVSTALKGQPGTEIRLLILPYGETKPVEKKLVREDIKVENIPYSGMLNDSIGYIKLTSFTANAGEEVKKAFLSLKDNPSFQGLIIDLRGNGGGLLQEAVNITNIFVDKNQLVVSTKGKIPERNVLYHTIFPPVDTKVPVAILVDQYSASASEILSGAFQDFDRGVVIGQKTFGKGLVQNIFPLSYNAQVKVTIAKYYIPSGRCIQAIDYSHKKDGKAFRSADSLKTAFKTKNGRIVYDLGGILPDIKTDSPVYGNITRSLVTKYLVFDFASKYASDHKEIASPEKFVIDNDIFNQFISFITDKDYDYTTGSEKKLEELKQTAVNEQYFDAIKNEYEALKTKLVHDKNSDLQKFRPEISNILKQEIVSRYYFQKGRIQSSLAEDKDVSRAIEVLKDKPLYDSILSGTYKPALK